MKTAFSETLYSSFDEGRQRLAVGVGGRMVMRCRRDFCTARSAFGSDKFRSRICETWADCQVWKGLPRRRRAITFDSAELSATIHYRSNPSRCVSSFPSLFFLFFLFFLFRLLLVKMYHRFYQRILLPRSCLLRKVFLIVPIHSSRKSAKREDH